MMTALVEETVDIEGLFKDFKNAVDQSGIVAYDGSGSPFIQASLDRMRQELSKMGGLRVGFAYDDAFSFYYDENLETFREVGVSLIPFSPLNSDDIPDSID